LALPRQVFAVSKAAMLCNAISMEPSEHTESVGEWGGARLVRFPDGHYDLQGGTLEDRKDATGWIRMFMPNVAEELKADSGGPSASQE
jgi:hypothetical protein